MAGSPPPGQKPGGYPNPPGGQQQPQQPQQPPPQGYPPPQQAYAPPPGAPTGMAGAPYGVHPISGIPFSDKQKNLAGILQLLPLVSLIPGVGRFYTGHIGIGVAQLILGCTGIGQLWSIIDGIIILTGDEMTDVDGRPLRPN